MRKSVWGVVAAATLLLSGCASGGGQSAESQSGTGESSQSLNVVTAFYPLTFVAQQVGGGAVSISDLTPAGGEAHDLELSPRQVAQVAEADLVLYLAEGFQPALEQALGEASGTTLNALDAVPVDRRIEGDPHVWLDPLIMADIGDRMAAEFAQVRPAQAADFKENAAALRAELVQLDADFNEGLAGCAGQTLVTSHEAFGYLAAAYGLKQVGVAGLDPESEPSPKRLAEVGKILKQDSVKTLFVESSDESQQRLADALGVGVRGLSTLESTPAEGDYLSVMRQNLQELEKGLVCAAP